MTGQSSSLRPHSAATNIDTTETTGERLNVTQNDEIFRILVSAVKDYAIFVLSPEGLVMTWNEGAQRIKGYTHAEIVGKHFSVFCTTEAKANRHPDHELEIARQTGRYEEEGWRVRKDGTKFWASVVITALYDKDQLIGFAKVTRDLSERRLAEQLREENMRQVAETNEELQRVAYVVSHELQSPLATIIRYGNLLAVRYKDRLGADANDFIDRITYSSKLINRMVDDLWTYARISKPNPDRELVFMRKAVDSALSELDNSVGDNEVTIGELPSIEGNKQQFVFLFKELIGNAARYRGTSPPRIHVDAQASDGGWMISVADNGIGIDQVRSNEVFTLFHRLEGRPEPSATGMGLAISKKIVEQHKGRIWFESQLGQGTTFYFWLPERQ